MTTVILVGEPRSGRSLCLQALAGAGFATHDDLAADRLADTVMGAGGPVAVVPEAVAGDPAAALRVLDAAGHRYQLYFVEPAGGGVPELLRPGVAESRERAHHRIRWTPEAGERARVVAGLGRRAIPRDTPLLQLISFGFKYGLPPEADWVVDARFTANPYWDPELRPLDGRDPRIAAFVARDPDVARLVGDLAGMLGYLLPAGHRQGRHALVLAVGCTGGRHRSVAITEALAAALRPRGVDVRLEHRELPPAEAP